MWEHLDTHTTEVLTVLERMLFKDWNKNQKKTKLSKQIQKPQGPESKKKKKYETSLYKITTLNSII